MRESVGAVQLAMANIATREIEAARAVATPLTAQSPPAERAGEEKEIYPDWFSETDHPVAASEPVLKLAQMLVAPLPGGRNPQWMTLPDQGPALRSSRTLSPRMPGAAGVGLPDPQRLQQLEPASAPMPDEEIAAQSVVSPVSPPSGNAEAAGSKSEKESFNLYGWEVPPIRWGGSLGYSYQKSSSNTGHAAASHGTFANLSASSYLYAPWFARVSGRLGITRNSTDSSSNSFSGSEAHSNANVVGGGEINMFSSSRFPFRAYFDRSDTRTSGTIVRNDYISNRFGFTQNFRSVDGHQGGNLMFDRNIVNSSNGAHDDVSALSGSYSVQTGIVQNNVNGRYSLGERSNNGDRARLIGVNSSHIANINDTLNLGATMNYSDTDIRTANSFGPSSNSRGRYLQLYGYGSWLPDFEDLEDLPLTLTGGLRYSAQDTQFGDEAFRAQSIGLNSGALYRHNRNLSLTANGAVNRLTLSQGESQLLTQVGTGLNYVGDPLTFGNFSYNWNSGLNLNWQSAVAETPSNSMLSGQFTHTLSRNYAVLSGQNLSLAVTQAINVSNSQMVGDTRSLTHTLSANLGLNAGERFTGSLSAMLSDVRTTGFSEQEYRVINIGFFGQGQISQVSNVNINLMFNWADQTYQTVDGFGLPINQNTERMTINGSAAYSHLRFAGVRGLRYNLIFVADTRLRDERLFGNVNGDVDRARFALTNRLEYRIGLLDLRLSLVNNDVGGKKNALLFFQVSRQIGSY
ncbi:MAG: hypothetical protein CVU34_10900 [Betaproteobacteria bacterium HGW-Betaproteobacteria-7]|jgi:hypothetical protein|nr:MAG: hypothetical protein CVU34_10900 [Betaproteobacteria bacterium HGW-Betaproteobacteria-7]